VLIIADTVYVVSTAPGYLSMNADCEPSPVVLKHEQFRILHVISVLFDIREYFPWDY